MVDTFKNIMKGCLKRNRVSQQKLYKRNYGYGMSICIRYAKSENEAIKILNNSFMKLFFNMPKCKSETDFKLQLKRTIEQTTVQQERKQNRFSIKLPGNTIRRVVFRENLMNH